MAKILVTGGTVFVSRYVAEYYVKAGNEVYVLNRNSRPQPDGVILIEADRHGLGNVLKEQEFDAVLDVTAYTGEDVSCLLDGLGSFGDYILISSSAVYPETLPQPFTEDRQIGRNTYWGDYGTNKIEAERTLQKRVPRAYILRPPYLYGEMNNVYREAFVFECAEKNRRFYLPRSGEMKLQFFYVGDLCRMIDVILETHPKKHIFNVGNDRELSVREWVDLCYRVVGKEPEYVEMHQDFNQRDYFCFHDYEYMLDVTEQKKLLPAVTDMHKGLEQAYLWYRTHKDEVNRKQYTEYIDKNFTGGNL